MKNLYSIKIAENDTAKETIGEITQKISISLIILLLMGTDISGLAYLTPTILSVNIWATGIGIPNILATKIIIPAIKEMMRVWNM